MICPECGHTLFYRGLAFNDDYKRITATWLCHNGDCKVIKIEGNNGSN